MFSRDLEVHALAIESQRLMVQAESVLRSLQAHQVLLTEFVDEARIDLERTSPSVTSTGRHRAVA